MEGAAKQELDDLHKTVSSPSFLEARLSDSRSLNNLG